ncbi:MAG: hypothetical protein Aurels2KO_09130 [Aureliella sp.]
MSSDIFVANRAASNLAATIREKNVKLSSAQAQALKLLVEQNSGALVLYARSWCQCPEDAVQEALLELVRQAELPDEPLAWLFQAVRWRAIAIARREHRLQQRHEKAGQAQTAYFQPPASGDITNEIAADQIQASLKQLGEVDHAIVVAKIWGKQTFQQIADAMELSRSSVHRRYQQSIAQLQELLSVPEE